MSVKMYLKSIFNKHKNQKGMGLIETIVALTLAVIVVTSLVSLTIFSLRSSQKSQDLMRGTKKASEQIELLRAKRDSTSWSAPANGFWASVYGCTLDNPCTISTSLGVTHIESSSEPIEPNVYNTYFFTTAADGSAGSLSPIPDSLLRVNVVVKWAGGGSAYSYTDLSNWRNN